MHLRRGRLQAESLSPAMAYLRIAMASSHRLFHRLKHLPKRQKELLALCSTILGVGLFSFAITWWWFRPIAILPPAATPYHWGMYAGCPDTWINTSDPDWVTNPTNHLRGGLKTSPGQAAEHMVACGIPFARNAKHRDTLIKSGALVLLSGQHITQIDIKEPYVTPLMRLFAERLSSQYYQHRCGNLVVTSAFRNREAQRLLTNGSRDSAHPTGMSIDLRIPTDVKCRVWLLDTLISLERNGRADVTSETQPAHYHVVLVPGQYEAWLMQEEHISPKLDYDTEEVYWLATALYFESAVDEPLAGKQAIASVIKNRRDSVNYPDTIKGVVNEGAKGQSNGRCQFSFMCDGEPQQLSVICTHNPKDTLRAWGTEYPCGKRWAKYYQEAIKLMAAPDNTNKAVLYYARYMDKRKPPYWKKDMATRVIIGSHVFGQSKWKGRDLLKPEVK